ncbi:conserved hypothetical protein [Pediculus humanus corporis]|uniref:Glycosyl transferase family 25 domain-containing protein n=1 Tax=Pediculus humanus subsp. corporis TaxID=121224 RepID=E0VF56_PEDHC|nr:uncharacterized protein Phum_PHUM149570 [Pediculus humanus corporis]EEB12012.1 conserved hypothetical protein [Pediculus humanus corporis]
MVIRNRPFSWLYLQETKKHHYHQDYPKNRIKLWIKTDHNVDKTVEIIETWISNVTNLYHSVNLTIDDGNHLQFDDEKGPTSWSLKRFKHLIELKEKALNVARENWADFIFVNCDVFLTDNETFKYLVRQNHTVTGPMLKSIGLYSNFWCGMTSKYYYMRTDDYKPILKREKKGCFNVPMIHSALIINLNKYESDYLTFNSSKIKNYNGPIDDIITFALSANYSGVSLHVCNEKLFGYVTLPLEAHEPLDYDKIIMKNLKVEILVDNPPLKVNDIFNSYIPEKSLDKLGFDKIYMINLKRRPERRIRMIETFNELELDVTVFDAVDGR